MRKSPQDRDLRADGPRAWTTRRGFVAATSLAGVSLYGLWAAYGAAPLPFWGTEPGNAHGPGDAAPQGAGLGGHEGPMLMLFGPDTPPKSRAEMEALAELPGIESRLLEHGTLGMAEEFAADLAPVINDFLADSGPGLSARHAEGTLQQDPSSH